MCVCQLQLQSRLPVTTVLSQTALWRPHEVGWLHGAIASSGFQGRSCAMLLLASEPKIQISLISQDSLLYWHPKFYYHVSWIALDNPALVLSMTRIVGPFGLHAWEIPMDICKPHYVYNI